MKQFLAASALAIVLIASAQQSASAWSSCKFGIGLNFECHSGNNCCLWGAFVNGPTPDHHGGGFDFGPPPMMMMAPPDHGHGPAPSEFFAPPPTPIPHTSAPATMPAPIAGSYPASAAAGYIYPASYYPMTYPATYYPMTYGYYGYYGYGR